MELMLILADNLGEKTVANLKKFVYNTQSRIWGDKRKTGAYQEYVTYIMADRCRNIALDSG